LHECSSKVSAYKPAKTDVAVLCNHQRTVSESFIRSMDILQSKMNALVLQIRELDKEVKAAKKKRRIQVPEQRKKQQQLAQLQQQLKELKLQAADKQEIKLITQETSELNYLDPRISVAWCVFFFS
ncbi:hypothetical protein CEXT_20781, partial [Caerostris extrusa]